jgi:hypothetical protein
MEASSRKHLLKFSVLVLLAIGLLETVYIPNHFGTDQSIFTIGASVIRDGGILYRDYWDLKQPGIFFFFLLAGTTFGFSEPGILAFEAIYFLAFSIVLIFTLRRYFSSPAIAACVPLFIVAFYYGFANPTEHLQVEGIVGFPLFLSMYFALKAEDQPAHPSSRFYFFLSGVFGGVVLVFKFVFLPIPVLIWAVTVFSLCKNTRHARISLSTRSVLSIGLGVSLPLVATLLFFANRGGLQDLLWATFEYPRRAVVENWHRRFDILIRGYLRFFQSCSPSLFLAALALSSLGSGWLNPLSRNLLVWVIGGLAVIHIQVLSWWEYHYILLFVPIGILATRGVDALWIIARKVMANVPGRRVAATLALLVVLLYSPVIFPMALRSLSAVRQGIPRTHERFRKLQRSLHDENQRFDEIFEDVQFLNQASSLPGPIYVIGTPVYYLVSGRKPAIPLDGWTVRFILSEQRAQLLDQLRSARPNYICVSHTHADELRKGFPEVGVLLAEHYRELRRSRSGDVWYVISETQTVAAQ